MRTVPYSDWIEVHNPTGAPIDLTDWCLTDDARTSISGAFRPSHSSPVIS
jgi:hypothetical protein